MKRYLLLLALVAIFSCQKTDLPDPVPTDVEQGKAGKMLVLAALIKNNTLLYSYEYANGRLVRTNFRGRPDKSYIYDDENLQTKVISGNLIEICQFNAKGVKIWKDEYLNNQFRKRITYQYKNKVFTGTQTTPAISGTQDTRMIYKNPWDYQHMLITTGPDGSPGEPTPGWYYRWSTPYTMTWYEPDRKTPFSVRKYSPFIRKPDYYMSAIPSTERLDQCAPYRGLLFDWTEVPPDNEPNLLLLERKDYYAYSENPELYVVVKKENIVLNSQGLPIEYTETGYWGPTKINQGSVNYRFVYLELY